MSCSICTEAFSAKAGAAALPCGHVFHKPCVQKWFAARKPTTCPTCRKGAKETELIGHLFLSFPAAGLNSTFDTLPGSPSAAASHAQRLLRDAREELTATEATHTKERADWRLQLAKAQTDTDKAKAAVRKLKEEAAKERTVREALSSQVTELAATQKDLAAYKKRYDVLKAKTRLTSALSSNQWLEKAAILEAGEDRGTLAELVVTLQAKAAQLAKEKDAAVRDAQRHLSSAGLLRRQLQDLRAQLSAANDLLPAHAPRTPSPRTPPSPVLGNGPPPRKAARPSAVAAGPKDVRVSSPSLARLPGRNARPQPRAPKPTAPRKAQPTAARQPLSSLDQSIIFLN